MGHNCVPVVALVVRTVAAVENAADVGATAHNHSSPSQPTLVVVLSPTSFLIPKHDCLPGVEPFQQ
jgi:hypothetical protein